MSKKILLFFLLIPILLRGQQVCDSIFISEFQDGRYQVEFNIPRYHFVDTLVDGRMYTKIVVDCDRFTSIMNNNGDPILPRCAITMGIPSNVDNVSVEYTITRIDTVKTRYPLLPYQDIEKSGEPTPYYSDSIEVFFKATDTENFWENCGNEHGNGENDDDNTPFITYTSPYSIHTIKGICSHIHPFKYNPRTGNTYIVCGATVNYFNWNKDEPYIVDPEWESRRSQYALTQYFDDPSNIDPPSSTYPTEKMADLLILAPSMYKDTLSRFVNYKSTSYNVSVIYSDALGTATPTSIKNSIESFWQDPNSKGHSKYVLLVGDLNQIPPANDINQQYDPNNVTNPFSDNGYAYLDGNDFYPEVHIGRFFVSNNNELSDIITKTINMETSNFYPAQCFWLLMSGNDPSYKNAVNNINTQLLSPVHHGKRIYHALDNFNDNDFWCQVDSGFSTMVYVGTEGETNLDMPFYDIVQESYSHNSATYPISFFFANSINNYTSDNCIGIKWLQNKHSGGVVSFASTTGTSYDLDSLLIQQMLRQHCFKHSSLQTRLIIDFLMSNALKNLPYRKAQRLSQSYIYLGDPTFKLYGNEPPIFESHEIRDNANTQPGDVHLTPQNAKQRQTNIAMIYNIKGQLIASIPSNSIETIKSLLPNGIYIISTNGETTKCLISNK